MVDSRPFDVADEEGFEGAVDVGDEVDGVEEGGGAAGFGGEFEFFALDHFDSDEHEHEIDESEDCEGGEKGEAGFAAGAEFDEAAEEHDDDADEHHDDWLHADDFAAEAAEVIGLGRG